MEGKEALEVVRRIMPTDRSLPVYEALQTLIPELRESEDEMIRKRLIEIVEIYWGNTNDPDKAKALAYLEKQKMAAAIPDELVECYKNLCERGNRGVASLIDAINGFYGRKFAPKFRVGDVMRTKQEAAEEMTDGMPVVVSIDDDYYICNNERIPIADQEEYEFPPMNTGQKPAEWSEEDEKMLAAISKALGCDTAEKTLVNEGVTLVMAAGFLESLPLRCPKSSDN